MRPSHSSLAIPRPVVGLPGRGVTHLQALPRHTQSQRVPNPPWGNTLGTSVWLKGGCSSSRVQSTPGWQTARSMGLRPRSLPLPGEERSACSCLLLPLDCSWAVQCWYWVRKQADKAGGIPADARKHPPLLQ